jgi:hypothetical protein
VRASALTRTRCVVLAVVLVLTMSAHGGSARAQGCCTPGSSPMGGITGGASYAGSLEFGASSEWFELDKAYEGSVQMEDPGGRYSRVVSTSLFLRVGLSRRLLAVVQLPFDDRMRSQDFVSPSGSYTYEFRNTALGDVSTLLMARVWPWSGMGPTVVNLGAGLKFPTGPNDATQDGLIIPFELQTGTGTYDPVAAMSAYRLFPWGSVETVATARYPGRATSGYRFGFESTAVLQASWNFGSWQFGPQLRARSAGMDNMRGRRVDRTGGHRLTGGVHGLFSLGNSGIQVDAAVLTPLWQNLYGLQLGVTSQFLLAFRWSP